ncbi:hypothetical protein FBU30_005296 [Linnemannia zychae]|nr:hypothetical protein FBU30_005296 [Linnemannia zychae]
MPSPGFFGRAKLAKSTPPGSKEPDALRIGILGAANIAPNALINPARHNFSIIVASVAARDHDKAKAFAISHGIPNTHPSYDALINDPTIDCIYNPLPNGLHYEWTVKALNAGKHVLLEKPATSNEAQAKELVTLAKSKNLVLLEAFHYRFHPASLKFKELVLEHVKSGHAIQKVEALMSFPMIFPKDDIRFNYNLAGGINMDAGCYTVNSIRYFSGLEVESVESAKATIVKEDVDGRMEATLKLVGGAEAKLVASCINSWLSLQTYRDIIPKFTIETDEKIFAFGVWVLPQVWHYISIKDKKTGATVDLPKEYGEGYSTYKHQLDAFVKAVKAKKSGSNEIESIPGWVSGENTIANMKVIDDIYRRAGMKIRE